MNLLWLQMWQLLKMCLVINCIRKRYFHTTKAWNENHRLKVSMKERALDFSLGSPALSDHRNSEWSSTRISLYRNLLHQNHIGYKEHCSSAWSLLDTPLRSDHVHQLVQNDLQKLRKTVSVQLIIHTGL